jgi:aminopeptidase N
VVKTDNELENLPADNDIWIFGWENKFRGVIAEGVKSYGCLAGEEEFKLGEDRIDPKRNSIVVAVKNPGNRSKVIVFMSADLPGAIDGLGRKLPHYGKYSYLAFTGEEPTNFVKGQWQITKSPLIRLFDHEKELSHKFPKRKALGYLSPLFSKDSMMKTISYLSNEKLDGRGIGTKGIDLAADFIAEKFLEYGLKPASDNGGFFQEWEEITGPGKKLTKLKNILAYIPGSKDEFRDQSVIVSAHYDHLGLGWPDVREGNQGKIHPGADDNASGVAVLLEIAKNLGKNFFPERNIIFIAFTGEENRLSGSGYFVRNYHKFPIHKIMGIVNLDTVGRLFGKKPMIIGSDSAREWKFIFMGIGYTTGIETEMITQELDASDQISFIREGIPGIQIFSGPHLDYHKPTDTVDRIDPEGLLNIAGITREAVVYLSERKEPMTFTGKRPVTHEPENNSKEDQRASIGIMPDFTYTSAGVRVGMPLKSLTGEEHILKKDDIVIAIGGIKISNLKEYSNELKKYVPGEQVEITYIRGEKEYRAIITMRSR